MLETTRIKPKSQCTIENFHCKKIGSRSAIVTMPRGINRHHDINKGLETLECASFSKITWVVTSPIIT